MITYIPVAASLTFMGIISLASTKEHDMLWYTLLASVITSCALYIMIATNDPTYVIAASWIGITFGVMCMVTVITYPVCSSAFSVLCLKTVINTGFYTTHVVRGMDDMFIDDTEVYNFIDPEPGR